MSARELHCGSNSQERHMAANALVQARIDADVKAEAAAVLAAMGLTVSDAVRLLLVKVAQDKALPFEPLIPNPDPIEALRAARDRQGGVEGKGGGGRWVS